MNLPSRSVTSDRLYLLDCIMTNCVGLRQHDAGVGNHLLAGTGDKALVQQEGGGTKAEDECSQDRKVEFGSQAHLHPPAGERNA